MNIILLLFCIIKIYYIIKYDCLQSINFLLFTFISLIIFKNKNKIYETFTSDNMRFIPCSDKINGSYIDNNYKLEYIDTSYDNNILTKLENKPFTSIFEFKNCDIDKDYQFEKTYDSFFDRKIFSIDNLEAEENYYHNLHKDLKLVNDPYYLYKSPKNIENKIIYDYDESKLSKYEDFLDSKGNSYSMDHTSCNNYDNKGNKYNCKFPYLYDYKKSDMFCSGENCKNVCCTLF